MKNNPDQLYGRTGECMSNWHGTMRRHAMETLSVLLAICEGDPLATGRGPVRQSLDVSYGVPLSKFLNK